MSIHEASRPFMDRVVLIGDCGVTRLHKDGIGAAFRTMHRIKAFEVLLKGMLRTTAAEQTDGNGARRMSLVLWDMFSGSAPYRDILSRTLAPSFLVGFLTGTVQAAVRGQRGGVVN